MILADTSVWVDHFRRRNPLFQQLILAGQILTHPFVIGEIACGNLPSRAQTLSDLQLLPQCTVAGEQDVLALIDQRRLWGRGIGWVDAHLLASALVSGCRLWSIDQRLHSTAVFLGIGYP